MSAFNPSGFNKNQPKSESKMDQQLMQNPSKINQKLTQNLAKISLGGVSGGPWGLLAAKIEKTRKEYQLLGPLGPSWGRLGGLLGPSWRLDRRLGRSWGRLGPSKNRCQNRSKNRCILGSIFGRLFMDFERENGGKLAQQSIQNLY